MQPYKKITRSASVTYQGDLSAAFPSSVIADIVSLGKESVLETLWPTRCAICDVPGFLICDTCKRNLPFIDYWRACPRCGAPYGALQCTECNSYTLHEQNRTKLPYSSCLSVVLLDEGARRLIITYKDGGERRLARVIAYYLACTLPASWMEGSPLITYIPCTKDALRRRGFDHMELVAKEMSALLTIPVARLLEPPRAHDQRRLKRKERFGNMEGVFHAVESVPTDRRIILVDDVITTGSTIMAASEALRDAGVKQIQAMSFGRRY